MIHLNCFVINSTDITIHLFWGICHSVHDTLNVALNGCDRGLEIMRNIADQFFVFFVQDKFFFCGFLEPSPHFLKITAKFRKLIRPFHIKNKIKISVFDILRGLTQLNKWCGNTSVNPQSYGHTRKYQDDQCRKKKILRHDP